MGQFLHFADNLIDTCEASCRQTVIPIFRITYANTHFRAVNELVVLGSFAADHQNAPFRP